MIFNTVMAATYKIEQATQHIANLQWITVQEGRRLNATQNREMLTTHSYSDLPDVVTSGVAVAFDPTPGVLVLGEVGAVRLKGAVPPGVGIPSSVASGLVCNGLARTLLVASSHAFLQRDAGNRFDIIPTTALETFRTRVWGPPVFLEGVSRVRRAKSRRGDVFLLVVLFVPHLVKVSAGFGAIVVGPKDIIVVLLVLRRLAPPEHVAFLLPYDVGYSATCSGLFAQVEALLGTLHASLDFPNSRDTLDIRGAVISIALDATESHEALWNFQSMGRPT